ncbi:hypothetical protein TH8_10170 [Thalassospira profundimaris]|nr:hypothetical protein TH8_10170 [Thalassospira profundimaris]
MVVHLPNSFKLAKRTETFFIREQLTMGFQKLPEEIADLITELIDVLACEELVDREHSVEFLAPSFDASEGLVKLPAFSVDAQSLHFLNFLLADTVQVCVLQDSGLPRSRSVRPKTPWPHRASRIRQKLPLSIFPIIDLPR